MNRMETRQNKWQNDIMIWTDVKRNQKSREWKDILRLMKPTDYNKTRSVKMKHNENNEN